MNQPVVDMMAQQPPAKETLLGTYFSFLRSPTLASYPSLGVGKTLQQILKLYSLHILAITSVGICIAFLGLGESHALGDESQISVVTLFVWAIILAPVAEECVFRLPLRPFILNFSLSLSFILGAITLGIWLQADITQSSRVVLLFFTATLAIGNALIALKAPKLSFLSQLFSNRFRLIFYGLAIAFGALHITNFDLHEWHFVLILTLPQTILGILAGYVRVRYGFGWAVFIHAFHNGIVVSPALIFLAFIPDPQVLQDPQAMFQDLSTAILAIFLSLAMLVYFLVGLGYAGMTAWGLIQEWQQNRMS